MRRSASKLEGLRYKKFRGRIPTLPVLSFKTGLFSSRILLVYVVTSSGVRALVNRSRVYFRVCVLDLEEKGHMAWRIGKKLTAA
jgi:hypothetical protein